MIRIQVHLRHQNVEKVRALQNGVPNSLNPVSKIEMRIPSIGVVLTDSAPGSYPIKWSFTPADDGLIEMSLGEVQDILDAFMLTTTGDTEAGSQWISNVPAAGIAKMKRFMNIEGDGITGAQEITSVDRRNNKVKIGTAATATATGTTFYAYDDIDSSIHMASLYVYNVDYPNGIYWNDIEVEIGF